MSFNECAEMKWLKRHGTIRAMESHVHSYEMIWIPHHAPMFASRMTIGKDEDDASRKMVNLVKDALFNKIIDK